MVAWQLGRRDAATLALFLQKIGLEGREFVTDDYEAYHQLIPENQLFTGKDLTYVIEQDNSNTRHYLARFRRKSKVTSAQSYFLRQLMQRLYTLVNPRTNVERVCPF
jgi:insertion element IS1 protein InsB